MSHETIRNDDFQRNTVLQCWNNVVTIQNNVATLCRVTSPLATSKKIEFALFELHRSYYSISVNLSSVSGVDCKGLSLSSEKEKQNYCLAFTPL